MRDQHIARAMVGGDDGVGHRIARRHTAHAIEQGAEIVRLTRGQREGEQGAIRRATGVDPVLAIVDEGHVGHAGQAVHQTHRRVRRRIAIVDGMHHGRGTVQRVEPDHHDGVACRRGDVQLPIVTPTHARRADQLGRLEYRLGGRMRHEAQLAVAGIAGKMHQRTGLGAQYVDVVVTHHQRAHRIHAEYTGAGVLVAVNLGELAEIGTAAVVVAGERHQHITRTTQHVEVLVVRAQGKRER